MDWAIVGTPYDAGVTYRPGTRFGPRSIREESQYLKPYHLEHDVMLTEVLSLADAGDSPVWSYGPEHHAGLLADWLTQKGREAGGEAGGGRASRLMLLGGDHSNTLAGLRAAHRNHGGGEPLALIHFDSHLDTLDVLTSAGSPSEEERYSHASPFIRAVEEGILDPKRMLTVGIKGPLNTPADLDYARDHGVTIVTADELRRGGDAPIRAFMERLGDDRAYLTYDIDAIDPAYAPGTGTPSIGGLSSPEALDLLRVIARARPNLVGADVVEVLPDRDHAGITALLAAHIVFEILCADALSKGAGRG